MKDESDSRTDFRKFDDAITDLIDGAPNTITIAEMVGALELQLHVLKNRMMGYQQAEPEKEA